MFWVAVAVSISTFLLGAFIWTRRINPLFDDAHLAEVAALAGRDDDPAARTDAKPLRTAMLTVGYTIRCDEGVWIHHISVSSPVTPARAAGTLFLGLVRGVLGLDGPPAEVFVSQNHVFHLIMHLTDEAQQAFADRPSEARTPTELRSLAIARRSALLPRLVERAVPATLGEKQL